MLKTFREQIGQMATDPHDPFTQHVRQRVGFQRAPEVSRSLRQMILCMPICVEIIQLWMHDTQRLKEVKRLHEFLLTYLYQPVDFINFEENGLFGYLDDAYVVAAVLRRTWLSSDFGNRKTLGKLESLLEQLPHWIEFSREVMPWETKEIETMLDAVARGDQSVYYRLANGMEEVLEDSKH